MPWSPVHSVVFWFAWIGSIANCFGDDPKTEQFTNRLVHETSPYLLQHAHNPVDWFPWSDEAFAKAKADDKPIFLSVGYSSCHWCHVMEHESFEDEEIANFLNQNFICIKVDREERPDVDAIYMQSIQMLTGRGGWPMSVFMTAEAKPFYGGSYFPARDGDREGMPGFLSLVTAIDKAWHGGRDQIQGSADEITRALKEQMDVIAVLPTADPSMEIVDAVSERLLEQFDPEFGGFGFTQSNPQRPKFPEPSNLFFLLDRATDAMQPEKERKTARDTLERTLDMMAGGGIQDHVGGGFHRYSVDRYWHIPHFEKMLYDNGQLASVYSEAYALTGHVEYRFVVENLLNWVRRDMLTEEGGFYAAMDADSEGEEGKYFRWTSDEWKQTVSPGALELATKVYKLDEKPNFEEHFYVPQTGNALRVVAERQSLTTEELIQALVPVRKTLATHRAKRIAPITDTKILTAWNGLMIRGFADAGRILENDDDIEVARRASRFALDHLRRDDGTLFRSYGGGKAKLDGYLDDYAFLANGLIALHRATGEEPWLQAAQELTDQQIKDFWDTKRGGFFFTGGNHETLIARAKDPVDSALPSGNSVSAENLLYLDSHIDGETEYHRYARATIGAIAGLLTRSPTSAPRAAVVMRKFIRPDK